MISGFAIGIILAIVGIVYICFRTFTERDQGRERPFYCGLQNESSKAVMQIGRSNSLRMRLTSVDFCRKNFCRWHFGRNFCRWIFADGFFADGFSGLDFPKSCQFLQRFNASPLQRTKGILNCLTNHNYLNCLTIKLSENINIYQKY